MTISPEAKEAAMTEIIPDIIREPETAGCLSTNETIGYLAGEISRLRNIINNSATAPSQEKITELQGDISTLKHVLRFEQEKEKNYSKRIAEAHSDLVKTVEQRDLAYQQIERLRGEVEKAYREGADCVWSAKGQMLHWQDSRAKQVSEGAI